MNISFLLHFYQPHDQQDDILNRIVNESYRPLTEGLLKIPRAKVVINISGALTALLIEKGYEDVVQNIKKLAQNGQVELTGSGMYHAFFPLIPEDEMKRQIDLNHETNYKAYGDSYDPFGFFVPEMAVNDKVLKVVSEKGYKWIAIPEIAKPDGKPQSDRLYKHNKYDINLFFRNKRVSSYVLSAIVRDPDSLIYETKSFEDKDIYWFCAMDAETFGHHRIGHEKVLLEILGHPHFNPILVKDILKMGLKEEKTDIRDCTWTNSEQDFHVKGKANSFILWNDPENPIHKLQWEFVDYVLSVLEKYQDKQNKKYLNAREACDKAIASDQFWWASAKPWWSLEMLESGAYSLKQVLVILGAKDSEIAEGEKYYRDILDIAFKWQRTGYIRKTNIENSGTYMKKPFKKRTPSEWYNQMLLELEDEMEKSARNKDYEKAIKWRDAIIKISLETDMYDISHVIDELWLARSIPEVKPFLDHEWDEFSDFIKDKFIEVKDKEEFDNWKKSKKL